MQVVIPVRGPHRKYDINLHLIGRFLFLISGEWGLLLVSLIWCVISCFLMYEEYYFIVITRESILMERHLFLLSGESTTLLPLLSGESTTLLPLLVCQLWSRDVEPVILPYKYQVDMFEILIFQICSILICDFQQCRCPCGDHTVVTS